MFYESWIFEKAQTENLDFLFAEKFLEIDVFRAFLSNLKLKTNKNSQ